MKLGRFAMGLLIVGGLVELGAAGLLVFTEHQRETYWAGVASDMAQESVIQETCSHEIVEESETLPPETYAQEETEPVEDVAEPVEEEVTEEIPIIEEIIVNVTELEPYAEYDFPDDGSIVYTTAEINVRADATTSSKVVGKLGKGERVFRYSTEKGWSRIWYNGQIAYIYNQYIDSKRIEPFDLYEEVDEIVYSGHDVNIRMAPSTYAPSIGKLEQGDSVRRIGIGKNGWSQVIYNNQMFFINSRYLSTDQNFVIPLEWFLEQAEKDKENIGETVPEESTTLPPDATIPSEPATTDPTT